MRYIVFTLLLSFQIVVKAQPKTINVTFNKNVEIINAIAIPLYPEMLEDSASNPWMFRNTQTMRLAADHFKRQYDHPSVEFARSMIRKLGTGIYLLPLYYHDLPLVKRKHDIPRIIWQELSSNKDSALHLIDSFMTAAASFYKYADFEEFIRKNKEVYAASIRAVQKNLPAKTFIPALEKYYGDVKNSYNIIIMPFFKSKWGMGWQLEDEKGISIFNISAPFNEQNYKDGKNETGFDNLSEITSLCIHEFGHSFVNTISNEEPYKSMVHEYDSLYEPIKSDPQYSDWFTVFNEYVVRAGEVVVSRMIGDNTQADKIKKEYADWIFLDHFIAQMEFYTMNRNQYKSFQDFLPVLIASLDKLKSSGK